MKINVTIEIDDEELKKLFNLKSEEEYPGNSIGRCPDTYSNYARFFDNGCLGWTKDSDHNMIFLKQQETYANDMLRSKGHLFLNEVYDMLGIPRSKDGAIVGWVYNEKNPIGDNCVDFGLNDERNSEFINGYRSTVILDFNVDGNILKHIETY